MAGPNIHTQAKILFDYFTEHADTDYPALVRYAHKLESAGRAWHGRKGEPNDFVHSAYLIYAGFPELDGSLLLSSASTIFQQLALGIRRSIWKWYDFKKVTLPDGTQSYETRGVPLPEGDHELAAEGEKIFLESATGLTLEELVHRMKDPEAAALIKTADEVGYKNNQGLVEGLGWKLGSVLKVKRRVRGWTLKLKEDAVAGRVRQEWETDDHMQRLLPRDRDSHLARVARLQSLGLLNKTTIFPPKVEKPFTETVEAYRARLRAAAKKEAGPGGASARGQVDTLSVKDLEMLLLVLREDEY